MKGMVFDIQHFCVDDGPGIRTTVFMKGCPLRCAWCHNPEGLSRKVQITYFADKCLSCGRCAAACDHGGHSIAEDGHVFSREGCVQCGACVEACPAGALKVAGREMEPEEALREVLKDRPFYENSGGGITLSGGEPFFQSEFALELLRGARQAGLHTCVETSGHCPKEVIEAAAELVDLFLFDVKETDGELHKRFTGVDNARILENLRVLAEKNRPVILRCPIIPGCNDRREHILGIAQLANSLRNVREVHLEPYHPFGVDKYTRLGLEPSYASKEFMPNEDIESMRELLQSRVAVPVKIS